METIKIALADDHTLLRAGLIEVLQKTGRIEVLYDHDDGQSLLDAMSQSSRLPDVVLLDVYMPGMNGVTAARHIRKQFPSVKVLALSMMDDERDVLRMVRNGAIGYILKGENPSVLIESIEDAYHYGITRSSTMSKALISSMGAKQKQGEGLSVRHREFCILAASDRTYAMIGDELNVSARTIDGYRDELFMRFDVKSRVGLVLLCLRKDFFNLEEV
jgi:DNA-binding NarL/FixJ family response regulator